MCTTAIRNKPLGLKLRVTHVLRLVLAKVARFFFSLYYGTEGEKIPPIHDDILKQPAVEVAKKIRNKESVFGQCTSRAAVADGAGLAGPYGLSAPALAAPCGLAAPALAAPCGTAGPFGLNGPYGLNSPYGFDAAYGFNGPYGLAGPYGFSGSPYDGIPGSSYPGAYGGSGEGNVAVAGSLPVSGNTAIAGQVPIMGAVGFSGPVAAAGAVSIAGQCACGCNTPYYC